VLFWLRFNIRFPLRGNEYSAKRDVFKKMSEISTGTLTSHCTLLDGQTLNYAKFAVNTDQQNEFSSARLRITLWTTALKEPPRTLEKRH